MLNAKRTCQILGVLASVILLSAPVTSHEGAAAWDALEPDPMSAPWETAVEVDVSLVLHVVQDGDRLYYRNPSEPGTGVRSAVIEAHQGDVVALTVVHLSDVVSDLAVPAFGVGTPLLIGQGASATLLFDVDRPGEFDYGSTFAELRARGLTGKLVVRPEPSPVGGDSVVSKGALP